MEREGRKWERGMSMTGLSSAGIWSGGSGGGNNYNNNNNWTQVEL